MHELLIVDPVVGFNHRPEAFHGRAEKLVHQPVDAPTVLLALLHHQAVELGVFGGEANVAAYRVGQPLGRREVAAQLLASLREFVQLGDDLFGRSLPDFLLAAEVIVHQVALHPGGDFDVAHGDRVEAALRERLQGGFDQLLFGGLGAFLRAAFAHWPSGLLAGRH